MEDYQILDIEFFTFHLQLMNILIIILKTNKERNEKTQYFKTGFFSMLLKYSFFSFRKIGNGLERLF